MSVDLIHLWGTMGWFAKGVVAVLAFMSIWSLTVMTCSAARSSIDGPVRGNGC